MIANILLGGLIIFGLIVTCLSVTQAYSEIDSRKGFWPWIVVALVGLVLMWTGLGLME